MPGALQGKLSDLRPHRCRVGYVCVVGLAWDFGQLRIRQDQREVAGNIGQPGRAGLADDEQNRDADRPEPLKVAAELIDRADFADLRRRHRGQARPDRLLTQGGDGVVGHPDEFAQPDPKRLVVLAAANRIRVILNGRPADRAV